MNSRQMRTAFFNFFMSKKHEVVASSSLIPAQDPTLLFTNAGMNQFKDLFLGQETRSYNRAVSIQKCVRAGGKHNDLDNVGFTKRHLTFFEMMGNFSFGDYFKKEAIQFAWEFLTEHIGLPKEKLHATVFETDDQAYDIWHTVIGLPHEKIHRLGAATNFWQMADVGPCGPCTEIFIDRGLDYGKATDTPADDSERFLEIWNLVFMQYDRQENGDFKPLKKTGVDTGMGLERLALVVQGKDTVFETDLFAGIIAETERLTGKRYSEQTPQLKGAFNVLADHIRSSTLLIADGCAPSNEGRGYVLRKIIRRAALFAQRLTTENIFPELAHIVVHELGDIYPHLTINQALIYKVLVSETEKFSVNLQRGKVLLEDLFTEAAKNKNISGKQAFRLYDTYGFPVELVYAEARERGYTVDVAGFEQEMERQKVQSGNKKVDRLASLALDDTVTTEFTGYRELETPSKIIALVADNQLVDTVRAGQECYVMTQASPFFIVGGGQVPDQGWLSFAGTEVPLTEVRYINNAIGVRITAPCALKIGDAVTSRVDKTWRTKAMKNHTATHMLQSALIELFGKQIKQSGSLVHPDYLRFDFTYHENLSAEDIKRVEELVNAKIMENIPVNIEHMTLKEATDRGALAFFGDKYKPDAVRMVCIDDFSTELCGGTHVRSTGDIGVFKITEVSAPAAGHRRIVAVTGPQALALYQSTFGFVKHLAHEYKTKIEEVSFAFQKQQQQMAALQTEVKQLQSKVIAAQLDGWSAQAEMVKNVPFLYLHVENASNAQLHDIAQGLMHKKKGIYFVESRTQNGVIFVCQLPEGVAVDEKILMTWLGQTAQLRGGVQKGTLQGGGPYLSENFSHDLKNWIKQHLA